jgi:hypothetical protein
MKFRLYFATAFVFPAVMLAQSLTGTVTGIDTGLPIAGATVVAIQKVRPLSAQPAVLSARTDRNGVYSVAAGAGGYRLCVQGAGLYLDPCQWGGAVIATIAGADATAAPLKLTKGGQFIVRVHDDKQLLRQAEAIRGQSVSVTIVDASGTRFLLPMTYDDGRVRDYGAVVPINAQMRAMVNGAGGFLLNDAAGAALSPQGVPFQVALASATPTVRTNFFKLPPSVTMVHVHVSH